MDRCAHWPFVIAVCFLGTSHDWRLRCGAVDLYFTLFGLSRPSCLPLPELGLVLNLIEKKAVLNPTIIPEAIASNQEAAVNPSSHAQLVGFQNPVRITCDMEKVSIVLLFRAPKKRIVSLELEDFRATNSFSHHFKKCWLTLSQHLAAWGAVTPGPLLPVVAEAFCAWAWSASCEWQKSEHLTSYMLTELVCTQDLDFSLFLLLGINGVILNIWEVPDNCLLNH